MKNVRGVATFGTIDIFTLLAGVGPLRDGPKLLGINFELILYRIAPDSIFGTVPAFAK